MNLVIFTIFRILKTKVFLFFQIDNITLPLLFKLQKLSQNGNKFKIYPKRIRK